MTAAPSQALDPTVIKFTSEELVKVLFIEHDSDYREEIKESLQAWGYSVDSVSFPLEAIPFIQQKAYQMVVFDVVFPRDHINGDVFVFTHRYHLKNARLVALTGNSNHIDEKIGKELKIKVIEKGYEGLLKEFSRCVYNEISQNIIENKEDLLETKSNSKYELADAYLEEIQTKLIKELENLEDKESKKIDYQHKRYSVNDLIQQIKENKPLGKKLVKMMVKLIDWKTQYAQKKIG